MTTTQQPISAVDTEPTDLGVRVSTGNLEWGIDTRATTRFRWMPFGTHRPAGVSWGDLRRLHPDAIVATPEPVSVVGRTIPSRRTDPSTSHAAEPTPVRAGTQRARLLEAFGLPSAAEGLTDEEAMEKATGVSAISEYAKRCSELRDAGLIEVVRDSEGAYLVRKGGTGIDRIVSRITDEGNKVLSSL